MKKTLTLRFIFSILFLSFFFVSFEAFAQPANDACTNATSLPCATSNLAGTTSSAVNETLPGCSGYVNTYGVWYTFVGDGFSTTISVTSSGSFDAGVAVFSGTCASKTQVSCTDNNGTLSTETVTFTPVNGTTYFVYIAHYNSTTTGNFTISRTCASPPANDACASATNLPCGTSNLAGTTVNSVSETHGTGCSMSNYGVWYTFAGDGNNTTITVSGGNLDVEIAVVSGSCASKTNISCTDIGGAGGTDSYTFTSAIGTTYFVYVGYYTTGATTGTFNISRTCTVPPTPPGNDACASATNLPCGTSALAGTTVNSVSETAPPTCGMSQYGVWYSFTGNGQITTITLQGNSYDTGLGIYSGSCGSFTNIACEDATFASDPETYTFTTVNGTVYYIYVAYYTTGATTGTFNISRTCTAAPTPPANDVCASATNLPCGTASLAGTTVNSVSETAPPTCGMSQYGVWYSFTGDGQTTTITLQGNSYDTGMGIYTGSCGSFTNLTCLDATLASSPEVFTFVSTIGTVYYIYVAYYTTGATTGTFNISRTCVAAPTPPSNDACASPTSLPCGTSSLAGTTAGSTFEAIPGCASEVSNYGVWYSFTGDGQQTTITVNTAGFDAGMAVFSGTCASRTQLYCTDLSGATGNETVVFTTVNGTTYLVYVAYYNSANTTTGAFTISRSCNAVSPCGNPATNDFCSNPALLTEGPGTFSATTDGTFTADQTQIDNWVGNGTFCGSLENNSWYTFTANTTTESFPITSVTGCNMGYGIQAHVYSIGYTGGGCCSTFSPVSNCYNPGNTTLGTVTANGLTIGNSYMLMIDGNAGDGCDFTISGWTASGILPVEMTSFTGSPEEFGDLLNWTTSAEINNDKFIIRFSKDGINFREIGEVDGAGTSNITKEYSFINSEAQIGINYYQIEQVDFNGFKKASEVIKVYRSELVEAIINIYPNPTQNDAYFEYYSKVDKNIKYRLLDCIGNVIESKSLFIEKGTSVFPIELNQLPTGLYLLEIESSDKVNSFKIIKN